MRSSCGLLFEQREQVLGLGVAGIAAGHKEAVDARKAGEHLAPFLQRELHGCRVRVVLVHGRIPDPDVQPVFVADSRHSAIISIGGGEMRAVGGVVRTRRYQFDGVGSEDRQVADVLVPHGDRDHASYAFVLGRYPS